METLTIRWGEEYRRKLARKLRQWSPEWLRASLGRAPQEARELIMNELEKKEKR